MPSWWWTFVPKARALVAQSRLAPPWALAGAGIAAAALRGDSFCSIIVSVEDFCGAFADFLDFSFRLLSVARGTPVEPDFFFPGTLFLSNLAAIMARRWRGSILTPLLVVAGVCAQLRKGALLLFTIRAVDSLLGGGCCVVGDSHSVRQLFEELTLTSVAKRFTSIFGQPNFVGVIRASSLALQ